MEFEWDERKNRRNFDKHGVSFEEAALVFAGPHFSRIDTREAYGEIREITIGMIAETVVAVVVHTDREDVIRIISARKANKRERKAYHAYCAKKTERPEGNLPETD